MTQNVHDHCAFGETTKKNQIQLPVSTGLKGEDSNTPSYYQQVRSLYDIPKEHDLHWKLHMLNKSLFSMEQMSIVSMLPYLPNNNWLPQWIHFFFPPYPWSLPSSLFPYASGHFLWVQMWDQTPGKIKEKQGLCYWCTLLSHWCSTTSAPPRDPV